MHPERWQQIEKFYHAALERAPPARAAFLAEACAGDEELRREVAALLAFDDPQANFLEAPALQAAAQALAAQLQVEARTDRSAQSELADTPTGGRLTQDALRPGQVIHNFRIVRKIGQGGMGEVYQAEDVGRHVALKLLPVGTNLDPQARQRLLREARAASALNHPNIVTVHAVEEADGLDFLVMEYVEGETLEAKIEHGPLELPQVLGLGVQIAEAVAAAHALGIIHRDLKPGNILITPGGCAKVLDFGLAKKVPPLPGALDAQAANLSRLTGSGLIVGTIPYMSPEQTRGEALDARSDIFALGCVLYEATTGKRPFNGPSALAVMHEIAVVDPPPPSALQPGLPQGFDRIVQRTLAKDKEHRYASAADLAEALRGLGIATEREGRRKTVSRLAVLAATAAVIAIVAGLWFSWRQVNRSWARESVGRVEELARAESYFDAYDLAVRVEKYLPNDPTLARLMPTIADELSVASEPAGARVYLKRLVRDESGQFPPRQQVGTTPIRDLRIARGEYILAIEKEGFAPRQRIISSALDRLENGLWDCGEIREAKLIETPSGKLGIRLDASAPIRMEVKLIEAAKAPDRMVFVPGGEYKLVGWGKPTSAVVRLDDYFIEQFEVTNREYKEFINAGGYRKKQFWEYPFLKDGKELAWEAAIQQFKDRTGLPGPRSWSSQNCPEGKEQHPVTEVTWYEAAAYAAFRGKQLPTVFQREKAARDGLFTKLWGSVMPWGLGGAQESVDDRANFKGSGTVPVDSLEFGMSPYGCYHMAGNAAEWCLNQRPLGFATAGGSWQDPMYLFANFGEFPGFYSASTLGFRCVLKTPQTTGDQGGMPLQADDAGPQFTPGSEAQFQAMLSHYRYDPTPLDPQVVDVKETEEWRREKITYVGAGGERALAYVYLPKNVPPPLQVIHYVPSGAVYDGLTVPQEVEVVGAPFIKSGRALFVAVLKGFRERRLPPGFVEPDETSVKFRDMVVNDTVDQRRGLDYLATRKDMDSSKIACFGVSVGGSKLIHMAVETRYRSVLILAGGLKEWEAKCIPEANGVNFVPYIRAPKLMLNGRYDEALPLKRAAKPLYQLIREPKRLQLIDAGHFPPLEAWVPVAKNWFDETLGPVPGP